MHLAAHHQPARVRGVGEQLSEQPADAVEDLRGRQLVAVGGQAAHGLGGGKPADAAQFAAVEIEDGRLEEGGAEVDTEEGPHVLSSCKGVK